MTSSVVMSMQGREHAVPLTEAQEGLWYAQRLDPENPIFNTGHCTEIRDALDLPVFVRAVEQTLREADALALRFVDHDDGPLQYIDPAACPVVETVDLSALADPAGQARQRMLQDLRTPLDPVSSRLARHVIFLLDDHHACWYQRVHHLAADGYGMALIEKRAIQLYQASLEGRDSGRALTSFREVVQEDVQYRASTQRVDDATFWHTHLQGLNEVASLSAGPACTAHGILQARRHLDDALIERLRQRQDSANCTWPDILTALIAAYVQRHTGQSEAVIGVPWMGRMGSASAFSVATVMNVAPLRLEIDQNQPLDELFVRCTKQLRTARKHGRYRSEQLRRDLGLLGGARRLHGPLVNILPFDAAYPQSRLNAQQEVLCAGPVEDLNFNFRAAPDGSGLRLELEANPDLYDQSELDAHIERVIAFIDAALQADALIHVQTLTPGEFQHWTHAVNCTAHEVPDTSLSALIQTSCAAHAGREALRFDGRSTNYAAFDTLVQRAATHLRAAGVRNGDIVAVALPRSDRLVLGLHAILRAGAAYLPLDIDQPDARLSRILSSARPVAVIGQGATLPRLAGHPRVLDVDSLFHQPAQAEPWPEPAAADPAYVIYTSGSTGEPKGVVVSHRAIVNRLLWMRDHYALTHAQCFLQKTPYTFDVSVWELFLPMLCGAPLVVAAPEVHRDPYALARLIRAEGVKVVHFVPSMLAAFLNEPGSQGLRLDHVYCSGEALAASLRDRFHARITSELHNLYGPTEAAVDVSYWRAHSADTADPLPIGFPVWNTQLYILDPYRRPVPPGVAGTLFLAGRQLAAGYLGRPDLTAARFITNPFDPDPDARMYDTGDLARWRVDGAVVYLGRADHQVKLRGQRIEPGEIEAVLARHPACRELAVVARTDRADQTCLVAYAVASAGQAQDTDALLVHARANLPEAMVPASVVWLDALPLSSNGKLDRKALPSPVFTAGAGRAAQTATEIRVAAEFRTVLALDAEPGADDDFFSLGGHSLLAARLAANLRREVTTPLPLGAIFEHPTVARLAAFLDAANDPDAADGGIGFGPLFTLKPDIRQGRPALFCIHPAGGLSWCYGLLARRLSSPRPIYGIQSPWLSQDAPDINSLSTLAQRYADQIQALQPDGPHHLLGWSVGGIIAQEIACELAARGMDPGVVCLLDAYPAEVWRDRPEPAADAACKAILHIAGQDPNTLDPGLLNPEGVIGFLRRSGHPLGKLDDVQLGGILASVECTNALVRRHHHRRYNGTLLYFRAALDHQGENLHPDMWQPWAAITEVHDVDSLHAHLTGEPAMAQLLPTLDAALATADAVAARIPHPCP